MELVFPSLLLLILAAGIVMFVIPRLSPVILGVLALIFLIVAGYQHYKLFGMEYSQSTWQIPFLEGTIAYAPYVMLGVLILFLLFFILNFVGTSSTEAAGPVQAMNQAIEKVINTSPTVAAAANTMKDTINRGAEALGLGGNKGPNRPANNRPMNRPPNSNRPPNNRPVVGGIPLSQI